MFETKQTQLITTKKKEVVAPSTFTNAFVNAGMKKTSESVSFNGSNKFSKTDDPFVDQFFQVSRYLSPRDFKEIAADCELLWAEDQLKTIKFIFYLRIISRSSQLPDGTKLSPQKGGELKHEALWRMIWLQLKAKESFWKNAWLIPAVGSWKDIFKMLSTDLQFNGFQGRKFDWNAFGTLLLEGLKNPNTSDLIKKYLPQLKANSSATTLAAQANVLNAKWLVNQLFGNFVPTGDEKADGMAKAKRYRAYRLLKTSGKAHSWQKLISQRKYAELEFDKIHGRALRLVVRSKFLKNHDLQERYEAWITKPETTSVKFTGFVHELFQDFDKVGYYSSAKYSSLASVPTYIAETVNKQFNELVNKAKSKEEASTRFIVVRDTSGSMSSKATGSDMSSYSIAKAMALYFSEFLTGEFAGSWIEFNSGAKMHKWRGNTPLEKWYNDHSECVANTNFQAVIDLFINIKRQGVAEEHFPEGLLCISDGEFDRSSTSDTEFERAITKLRVAGFSEEYLSKFLIILWDIPNGYYGGRTTSQFESYDTITSGVLHIAGYNASLIQFLSDGKVTTQQELMETALSQDILQLIEL